MDASFHKLQIVILLTIGFGLAALLGYLSQRLKLSPILGYMFAGYMIGPFSPGYVADLPVAEQLAEIGVILMMLNVGLHFRFEDLLKKKSITVPGAILQTSTTTILGSLFLYWFGWSLTSGIIVGFAIGVASTVVLVKMLDDNRLLHTSEGHIAVGWLVVEDLMTIVVLLFLPLLVVSEAQSSLTLGLLLLSFIITLAKLSVLIIFMMTIGRKIVAFTLLHVARTRNHELLSLIVLALTFLIATGSFFLFGTSIALGAFIAGMMIGQTAIRDQAVVNASNLKDVFVVIFFLTVGMLFNPQAVVQFWPLFLIILSIILIAKPVVAFLLVLAFKYPFRAAVTVGIALAQIGEFSFILAEEALNLKILPDEGFDLIVACALVSIALNPILFQSLKGIESIAVKFGFAPKKPGKFEVSRINTAIVIGYGPLGEHVRELLERRGYRVIVIDQNVDTITKLLDEKKICFFGDASHTHILEVAQVEKAQLIIITVPETATNVNVIQSVRNINPGTRIFTRIRYLSELSLVESLGVEFTWCEEEEAMEAFEKALDRSYIP